MEITAATSVKGSNISRSLLLCCFPSSKSDGLFASLMVFGVASPGFVTCGIGSSCPFKSQLPTEYAQAGEQLFGRAWEKGLCWELAAELPDRVIRKLLHKGGTAGNLFPFSGNSFAQVGEEEKQS